MVFCAHCQDDCPYIQDPDNGITCCGMCGKVFDEHIFEVGPTFVKNSSGQLALDNDFTKGRRTSHVAAACLYIACRIWLGNAWLCQVLLLGEHPIVQKLVDPSLFIHRFTERLSEHSQFFTFLFCFCCDKLLFMRVLLHPGAAAVVHVCEATLFKRLVEFENTDSGSLTLMTARHENFSGCWYLKLNVLLLSALEFMKFIETSLPDKIEDFLAKADEETVPNCPAKYGEVLCEHKGAEYFSHGLCEECHYNFTELSGGLEGGADPPAFQRAEKKRHDAAKRAKDSSVVDATLCELHSSDVEHNIMSPGKNCVGKSSTGSSSQTANDFEAPINPEVEGENGKADSDPGNLSDIDDVEVDGYLHNEEETQNKKIIWEEMNKEYLDEQAAKEALAAELSARGISVGEGRPKKRKRKEDKNSTPAETPAEATCNMLKRKGLGSKINVEAISGLYNTEDEVSKANGKDDVHFDEEYEHNVGYGETFDASYDYGHDADYIDEGGGGGYDDCHDADY
ncbi:unnamed protein product [Triticum turgidum subsp. durum]|uniref:Transcription factor IIIB 90 kDa subunit n=1 Tax=Triticum turgidum subsp. durum TaxID=4567 RepID=A0A9R0WND5_TRITD|nr:unnamed protein product [Triticum turgidum subsp. durum]